MIRRTSISTYKAIQENGVLSFKRMMVYDYLYRNGHLTGGQLQKALGGGVSESVRNRVTELVKMGVVYEVKETKCPITGRNVMLFDVTENMPKEYVAPKSKNEIIRELELKIKEANEALSGVFKYYHETCKDVKWSICCSGRECGCMGKPCDPEYYIYMDLIKAEEILK